jgi:hypothetical protein
MFVVMVLWVNSHGVFITGITYVFIDIAGNFISMKANRKEERENHSLKDIGLIIVVSLAAIFVNPVGYHILSTIFNFLGNQYLTSHTMEYQAPSILIPAFIPYYLFLAISLIIIFRVRKSINLTNILQLAVWSIFGLMSARNIPLAVLVGLPILSRNTGCMMRKANELEETPGVDLLPGVSRSFKIGAILIPVAIFTLTICIYWVAPSLSLRNGFLPEKFPVRAVDFLESHPVKGNMFNEFTWGGYLLYRLWPEQKVFIDGQTDFYGEKLTRDYDAIYNSQPGYEQLMQRYKVDWVIIQRTSQLALELEKKPNDWTKDYSDELSVIYTRK